VSSGTNPVGADSEWCNSRCTFTWRPQLPEAGTYEVFTWFTPHPNRITDVPYQITHAGGVDTVLVNQRINTSQWVSLGTYSFDAGAATITISSANGQANADAVELRKGPNLA